MSLRRLAAIALTASALALSSAAQAEERQLSPDEIRSMLIGKKVDGGHAWMAIYPDGTAKGEFKGKPIALTYRIKDDGQWCRTFKGVQKCQTITRDGDTIRWYDLTGDKSFEGTLTDQ